MAGEFEYIMVTDWSDHWDKLASGKSSYVAGMFRWGMSKAYIRNGTPTVFIKLYRKIRDEERRIQPPQVERVWRGSVSRIEEVQPGKYAFYVDLGPELPDRSKYQDLENGWYLAKSQGRGKDKELGNLKPPFFDSLLSTHDNYEFEQYTSYLLKLLGVSAFYAFDPKKQAGRPDGFFKVGNLAVIYDCTLKTDFQKDQQIKNYCNTLEAGNIQIDEETVEKFPLHERQVWIITRGVSRTIKREGAIVVKEIAIQKLFEIYEARLLSISTEQEIASRLKTL